MIKFNEPLVTGKEQFYLEKLLNNKSQFSNHRKMIIDTIKKQMDIEAVFLVNSCTSALEIAALSLDIKEGDEVIMPSYTYVSTANAFALRGAKIVFVDITKKTMNIDLNQVRDAITDKTRVIVPVHYGGVSCDMDELMAIAQRHNLYVVEDAAQAFLSQHKKRYLGSIGHIGCISLHETKNITSGGQGGILLVNDKKLIKKVELIVENGTNRIDFLKGEVKNYTWQGLGSNHLMSSLNVSFFLAQYEMSRQITQKRIDIYSKYRSEFQQIIDDGKIEVMEIPKYNRSNGHMFYIITASEIERSNLMSYLMDRGIESTSHYQPLHSSKAGKKYGEFRGCDKITTSSSKRLLRLPLHLKLSPFDIDLIIKYIKEFYT